MIQNKFELFYASSWSCSIIFNRTRNPYPATAPDCPCQAGPTPWSVTLLVNRTSPNILPLCKVMFPGSLHPLGSDPLQCNVVFGCKLDLVIWHHLSGDMQGFKSKFSCFLNVDLGLTIKKCQFGQIYGNQLVKLNNNLSAAFFKSELLIIQIFPAKLYGIQQFCIMVIYYLHSAKLSIRT